MTEIATIYWFERWGTSVFSENTAIFLLLLLKHFGCYGNLKFSLTYYGESEN